MFPFEQGWHTDVARVELQPIEFPHATVPVIWHICNKVIGILDFLILLPARCGFSPLLFAFLDLVLESQGCVEEVQTPV